MNHQEFCNTQNGLIVAVDGPSGAGKSTVCRILAKEYGAKYLDTGAMYRVATLHVLNKGIDPQDAEAVAQATATLPLSVNDDPASKEVLLAGQDVQHEIRSPQVNRSVSVVAANAAVRENLVNLQRQLAHAARRCIVDGRDIGTTVLVDAPLKVFITASANVRATRRYEQEIAAGMDSDFDTVLADVVRRDELDSTRAISPLVPAEDAKIIDTSEMSLEEVLEAMRALIDASKERTFNE